jgi:hypothetical protein
MKKIFINRPFIAACIAGLLMTVTQAAFAEYRVYKLRVFRYPAQKDRFRSEPVTSEVLSTLDHRQYQAFHGGHRVARVEYVDSWICTDDTSHYKSYCPPPEVGQKVKP